MSEEPSAQSRRDARAHRAKQVKRVTVTGVIGELLLTAGLGTLGFMAWKYWLNDIIQGDAQNNAGISLSAQFEQDYLQAPKPQKVEEVKPAEGVRGGPVPIREAPKTEATRFAVLYVPAFGKEYSRTVASGISTFPVLNNYVGYYPDSDAPGAVGNFALAGHRLAYGAPMQNLPNLQVGDHAYVETVDGWYEYEYRSGEYVDPYEVSILAPVPRYPELPGGDRIMVLMTCNPIYSTAERVVAYLTFVGFTPRNQGAPDEIAATVNDRTTNNDEDTGKYRG